MKPVHTPAIFRPLQEQARKMIEWAGFDPDIYLQPMPMVKRRTDRRHLIYKGRYDRH